MKFSELIHLIHMLIIINVSIFNHQHNGIHETKNRSLHDLALSKNISINNVNHNGIMPEYNKVR